MNTIHCARPRQLIPKLVCESQIFNFYGPMGLLAALTGSGLMFVGYEDERGNIEMRHEDGTLMQDGPVLRFITQHLQALKAGAVPTELICTRKRP